MDIGKLLHGKTLTEIEAIADNWRNRFINLSISAKSDMSAKKYYQLVLLSVEMSKRIYAVTSFYTKKSMPKPPNYLPGGHMHTKEKIAKSGWYILE